MSALRPRPHARRLGWLLSRFRDDVDLDRLRGTARPREGKPSLLATGGPKGGILDPDWGVIVDVIGTGSDFEKSLRIAAERYELDAEALIAAAQAALAAPDRAITLDVAVRAAA